MKTKLRFMALVLLGMMLSVNQVWGGTDPVYTNNCPKNSSNSGYSNYYDVTINNIKWKAPGNQYETGAWRLGEKSSNTVTRYLYTKDAMSQNISSITVTHGDFANMSSGSTIQLDVYTTAALAQTGGSGDVSSESKSISANTSTTFTCPTGKDWTGRFYRFTYTLCLNGTSKKAAYITLSKIEFYASTKTTV